MLISLSHRMSEKELKQYLSVLKNYPYEYIQEGIAPNQKRPFSVNDFTHELRQN